MDILIKNMEMPSEGRIINLTICSDGSVINNLPDAGGKMSSYRSERVKAIALPERGRLIIADALLEKLEKIALPDDLTYTIAHGILKQIIEDAPTIVEASE